MNGYTADVSSDTGNIHKKPRATRACDICRRKKVKCDGLKPLCTNCTTFGYKCTYLDKPKKRGPQASNPHGLEARLKRIETALAALLDNKAISTSGSVMDDFESVRDAENNWNKREETLIWESSDNERSEVLDSEFTRLTINDQARYKYLGSSSGIYLLEGGNYHINGIFKKFTNQYKNSKLPRLPEPDFPSKETQDKLLNVYFTRSHPYFPIFNKSGFLQRLSSGKKVSKVLLNAIYAVGCILEGLTVFKSPEVSRSASIFFFKQAKTELDKQYHFSSLYTVQALLLMTFNPVGGWLFLGMAIRMAQDLGLHRNIESDDLDPIEKQNRKLAWWGCVVFDRLHSAMGGKPLAINEDDYDTTLPMDLSLKDKSDISVGSSMSLRFLTQTVRLTMLISKIIRGIYVPRGGVKNKISTNLWSLNKSLSDWEASLSPEFRVHYNKPEIITSYSCLINIFYQYSTILLNRPFIPRLKEAHAASSSKNPAQLICQRAASRITWILYHTPLEWQLHGISVKPGLMFSSSTIHLINAMSTNEELARVAKNNLAVNLKIMRKISKIFFGAAQILPILEDLARVRGLNNLDVEEKPILYDPPSEALSPDILQKQPRRTDFGSVIVLPNPPPFDNMEAFCDPTAPQANPGLAPSLPTSSNEYLSMANDTFHRTPINQFDSVPNSNEFNIAEPIYQSQNTFHAAPANLFENTEVYPTQELGSSSTPQLSATSIDTAYQTLISRDFQGIPTERTDNDAPLLNLLQVEIDFNDWNNYLNQFGQSNSNST